VVCQVGLVSVAGAKRVGVNPKVNNMLQGYEAANYELILISDCGLRSEYRTHWVNDRSLLLMAGLHDKQHASNNTHRLNSPWQFFTVI